MCTLRLIKYPLRVISDLYALLGTALYGLLGDLRLLSTLEYFSGQVKAEVNKAARGSRLRGRGGVWGGEVNNAAGEVNNATDAEVN